MALLSSAIFFNWSTDMLNCLRQIFTESLNFSLVFMHFSSLYTFHRKILSIRTTWPVQRRHLSIIMDSMLGSPVLSNTSVSGIWDCNSIQSICRRHRSLKRSRVLSWCLYSVHISLANKRTSELMLYRPWPLFRV